MRKLVLSTAALGGLICALSVPASAAPLNPLLTPEHAGPAPSVQQIYYYWHHRRYYHRGWDRRHRRWYYY